MTMSSLRATKHIILGTQLLAHTRALQCHPAWAMVSGSQAVANLLAMQAMAALPEQHCPQHWLLEELQSVDLNCLTRPGKLNDFDHPLNCQQPFFEIRTNHITHDEYNRSRYTTRQIISK